MTVQLRSPVAGRALPRWLTLGVAFGVVVAASVALWGPIGVSTTYHRLAISVFSPWNDALPGWAAEAGRLGSVLAPEAWLVLGLFVGGWLARRRKPGGVSPEALPVSSPVGRRILAGILIVLGARLAGGCTSGHIISGISQQALSGMVFGAAVFGSAILTARFVRRVG
ncbi:MAG: YeeE/YedE thiosulfate transporter family protein [Candidatus Sericytochromatia bacterium]|nr:YeeE/YedE thiosulfate transporter family protein [Candidatus Sericytochromatia bacterium]